MQSQQNPDLLHNLGDQKNGVIERNEPQHPREWISELIRQINFNNFAHENSERILIERNFEVLMIGITWFLVKQQLHTIGHAYVTLINSHVDCVSDLINIASLLSVGHLRL